MRRLLLPPGWIGDRPYRLPVPDAMEIEEIDELVATLEAENKVMKAVLRSEREAVAELRAQVAALTTQQPMTRTDRRTCAPTATAGPPWSSACCSRRADGVAPSSFRPIARTVARRRP